MFCFFCCFWELVGAGDSERLRLVVVAGTESEVEELEVEDRLVLAVEGFWAEAAWRVSLESLAICVAFGVSF